VVFAVEKQCVLREVKQVRTISTLYGTMVSLQYTQFKKEVTPAIRGNDKRTDRPNKFF
jgi:hypothetical protein